MNEYRYQFVNFESGKSVALTLRVNPSSVKPKEKEGDWGPYVTYFIPCEAGLAFNASKALWEMLTKFSQGDKIKITRTGTGKETRWNVEDAGSDGVSDMVLVQAVNEMNNKLDQVLENQAKLLGTKTGGAGIPQEEPEDKNGPGF